jgi:NAD(P)-dependent dehydrogenase (short-subunit alcohol dehydrogenase family)
MKQMFLGAALALAAMVTPAMAEDSDICKMIVNQARAGLQANKLHDVVRERLQDMLRTGLKGDAFMCMDVANGSLASPNPEGEMCNEKPSV